MGASRDGFAGRRVEYDDIGIRANSNRTFLWVSQFISASFIKAKRIGGCHPFRIVQLQ